MSSGHAEVVVLGGRNNSEWWQVWAAALPQAGKAKWSEEGGERLEETGGMSWWDQAAVRLMPAAWG